MGQYYWHPDILEEYDVFPLVTACGKESRMTIRPTGGRQIFVPGKEYQLEVCAFEQGEPLYFPLSGSFKKETIRANQEGGFEVTHLFSSEQAYYLRFSDPDGNILYEYPVYAVNDDLQKRYPFWGDLHLHTTCSDGAQTPEVMTADCRAHGYDFLAITDHRRYYPSLRAIDFCRNLPTELCVCPGEEVQLSAANGRINDVHIINFGGEYSINALFPGEQRSEVGTDPAIRSLFGKCPEACSQEAYNALMTRLTEEIRVPAGVDPYPAASCKWIFEEIRKAGGLGILAHPYWLNNVFHIPAGLLDYLVENRIFDAMEVLGGERYFEQNGFQTIRYYEDKARGFCYPIVGASDSHSSLPTNPDRFISSSIVFARKNTREELISAIRECYCVAMDTISREYRMVGDLRLVKYADFLWQYYFPRHNELCQEEGRLIRVCATGREEEKEEARALLQKMYGRVARLREKYIAF